MYLTEKLANFVVRTAYEGISGEAVRKAKECILDCVGVIVAGTTDPIKVPVRQFLEEVGGNKHATIMGLGGKTSVTGAALANGIFGHVLDYDDTNQIFIGHATVVVVPAILALAEKLKLSGKDVITAYMVGTEVQWRLGDALVQAGNHYAKGWHSTCTIGSFGATAAAAKLLRLDAEATSRAFGIVASEAAGFQQQFGTHCKPFHAGRANEIGVRAALLAKGGFTSAKSALEGSVGYLRLVADEYDLDKIDNFARPWGILEPSFGRGINLKTHPICASGIGAVEGMQSLMQLHGIAADQVESVECRVRPGSLNILRHHDPRSGLEAKFSVEYWMAITLLEGRLGLRQTTDEAVRQPAVRDLIKKVSVVPDPSIHVATAKIKIHVKTKDGRSFDTAYYPAKGSAENPMSEQELVEKFRECADWGGLPKSSTDRALDLLLGLERLTNIEALIESTIAIA